MDQHGQGAAQVEASTASAPKEPREIPKEPPAAAAEQATAAKQAANNAEQTRTEQITDAKSEPVPMNLGDEASMVQIEIAADVSTPNQSPFPQVDPYEQSYGNSESSSEDSQNGQNSRYGSASSGSDTLNELSTGDENATQPADTTQKSKKRKSKQRKTRSSKLAKFKPESSYAIAIQVEKEPEAVPTAEPTHQSPQQAPEAHLLPENPFLVEENSNSLERVFNHQMTIQVERETAPVLSPEKEQESKIRVHFHALVCPDVKVNPRKVQFGIVTNLHHWEPQRMKPLGLVQIRDGNFIVTGQISYPVNINKPVEYRYAYRYISDGGDSKYWIENQNDKSAENRTINSKLTRPTKTLNIYDGMVFIPDEENKKGMMGRVKSFVKNIISSSSKEESTFGYKEMIDRAMLYQLDLLQSSQDGQLMDMDTFRNFEKSVDFLYELLRYFMVISQVPWESAIGSISSACRENNITSLVFSAAVLYLHNNENAYGSNSASTDFKFLLSNLNVLPNQRVGDMFGSSSTYLSQFVFKLPKLFMSNRFIPESIYALELYAKLMFGEDTNLEGFILSNNQTTKQAAATAMREFADVSVDTYLPVLKTLERPSHLAICLLIPTFLRCDKHVLPQIETFTSHFTIQHLLISVEHTMNNVWYFKPNYFNNRATLRFIQLFRILTNQFEVKQDSPILEQIMKRCRRVFETMNRVDALFNEDDMFKILALFMKLFVIAFGKLKHQLATSLNNEKELNERLDQQRQAIMGSLNYFHEYMDYHRRQALLSCTFNEMTNIFELMSIFIDLHERWRSLEPSLSKPTEEFVVIYCIQNLNELNAQKLVKVCLHLSQNRGNYHPEIEKCAFEAIKHKIEAMNKHDLNELTKLSGNQSVMSDLANQIMRVKWPKSEDPLSVLGFIFDSFHFLSVFILIEDRINSHGSEFVKEKFQKTTKLIENILIALGDGTIRCDLLIFLNDHITTFIDLFEKIGSKLNVNWLKPRKKDQSLQDIIAKLTAFRKLEFDNFQKAIMHLHMFATFAKKSNAVHVGELMSRLTEYTGDFDYALSDVLEPLAFKQVNEYRETDQMDLNPRIRVYQDLIKQFGFINKFISLTEENLILSLLLKQKSEILPNKPVSIEVFLSMAIMQSWTSYQKLGESVKDGTFVLGEFDRLGKEVENSFGAKRAFEWRREFTVLLQEVSTEPKALDQRIKQIEIYGKLGNIKQISSMLMEIKRLNKLEGNFDALKKIYESLQAEDFNRKRVNQIDEQTMRIYRLLEDLSQKNVIKCLKRYIKNFDFIQWLKETAPTLEKLKFLAELASESENEGALEIIRCQSLTMVGTAYGPLIYELNPKADFEELLSMLKLLHANLKKNPKLADKIDAIAKEKSWLEEVKNSKGNSEANSIKQALKINERGTYTICADTKTFYHDMTLNDIVTLKVPKDDNDKKDKDRVYKYNELVDLNDKLTLVVGKDEQQQDVIQYFADIFEGVISLGEVFLSLLKSGNVLFKGWHATVFCQVTSKSTIKVNFGLSAQSQNIFGDRVDERSTLNSLNTTIKFLKTCLDDWLDHVNQKREVFAELNHFRIDQIVILRSQLARVDDQGHERPPPSSQEYQPTMSKEEAFETELYPLLYSIHDRVNFDILRDAYNYALAQESGGVADSEPARSDGRTSMLESLLSGEGFSKKLVKMALRNVRSDNDQDYINYCLANELNEDLLDIQMNEVRRPPQNFETVKKQYLVQIRDPYEALDEASTLEIKYQSIWNNFKTYMETNFESFVSINHLGHMLRYLKQNSSRKIRRNLPPYLDPSVPNLIICAQDQIISRTLSMYMLTPDQPLPTDDEILYCTANTTADQIELFWKRVLHYDKRSEEQKLFCLLNPQDLAYDQAVKAQLMFEKLFAAHIEDHGSSNQQLNNKNSATPQKSSFNLCVLCSSEKEDKSVFVTAFNRYKKNVPLDNNADLMIRDYLSFHFKLNQNNQTSASAAVLEKDNLNVRVITSDRAGCGKSLYIKRLIESPLFQQNGKMDYHCIPIKKQTLPFESVFKKLKVCNKSRKPRLIHFDIAYEVWYDVDPFLFNLLCMNYLVNASGEIWRRTPKDLCLIEIMPPRFQIKSQTTHVQTAATPVVYKPLHSVLNVLPTLNCLTPTQTLQYLRSEQSRRDITMLFDDTLLVSETVQRSCQYLEAIDSTENLDGFTFTPSRHLDSQNCIELLLKHSEIENPSWSELIHFASFLNIQLKDSETSVFCGAAVGDLLPGFKSYVIKFLIQISHDFALPSLEISDRSALQIRENDQIRFELNQLKMRRKWEVNPHPYLFFNPDGQTFTFFGFNVERATGVLVDPINQTPIFEDDRFTMTPELMRSIERQGPSLLREDITKMNKQQKLLKLLNVINKNHGFKSVYQVKDPDPSYELTMDNLLKMLAIHMRFRANIPVIIMGETGCGKTRLIEYYCELLKTPGANSQQFPNLCLVKVHGGTTSEEIIRHVKAAQRDAKRNSRTNPGMYTVLFFDEANSTEAIGTIKEVMCDYRMDGTFLEDNSGLKIIAACNPYKKHSDEAIANFEKSGLGFYVDMNETQEKLGDIPMRHLVYRVQPLPASMLPMIWDFGHLNDQIEGVYIKQIVNERFCKDNYAGTVHLEPQQMSVMETALHTSQMFLRTLQNECSYVSLRDIQRVIAVFQWLLNNGEKIFEQMDSVGVTPDDGVDQDQSVMVVEQLGGGGGGEDEDLDEPEEADEDQAQASSQISDEEKRTRKLRYFNRALILALNTCYHVGLQSAETRQEYRNKVARCFHDDTINPEFMLNEINKCYTVFLNEIKLPDAIARNQALKENIFMMILCIELKIPLFIIGKPGSSKSLSKTLIAQKMQGSDRTNSKIFSSFKEAHLVTFQCSPLSTSDMILKTFRHCAKFQLERQNDLDRYTSVVVLDEIGLAEASPSMPLKALHPLLEKGVYFEEEEERKYRKVEDSRAANANAAKKLAAQQEAANKPDWHKVGFLGISNWVLDPAKMNRGIFVNRSSPSIDELKETIQGICKNDNKVLKSLETNNMIESISKAYLRLCESAKKTREFFGLRDFYSLIKMIYWYLKENDGGTLEWPVLEKLVKRNFGGLIDTEPRISFVKQFQEDNIDQNFGLSDLNVIDLVKEALLKKSTEDENRYLLLLAQNENALELINNYILTDQNLGTATEGGNRELSAKVRIIFGSSFPNDQNYSQICRKIHQIKLSMEMGSTVILLNLENLYESLYDALNQFYYKFGQNEKFVDLGLGTQRVKCLVHDNFRLIVVADRDTVYDTKKFPIPLVNRLEKHLLSMESILTPEMKTLSNQIKEWCDLVVKVSGKQRGFQQPMRPMGKGASGSGGALKPSDIFVGLTDDAVPSLVFKMFKKSTSGQDVDMDAKETIVETIKRCLLQCATSDAIMRLIESNSTRQQLDQEQQNELNKIVDIYFKEQQHDNFKGFCRAYCVPTEEQGRAELSEGHHFIQITTNSKLLSVTDMKSMATEFDIKIKEASLLAFDTQQQFRLVLKEFLDDPTTQTRLLIIQCECAHFYSELINCARFTIIDEYKKYQQEAGAGAFRASDNFRVLLVIQIPKIAGGCVAGFQTANWFCYHIDELQDDLNLRNIINYQNKSLGELFSESLLTDSSQRQITATDGTGDESMEADESMEIMERKENTNNNLALYEDNYLMLKKLLKTTVYIACSKINDQPGLSSLDYQPQPSGDGDKKFANRTVMRIEILINLLTSESQMSQEWLAIVMRHLTRLQLSRESTMSTPARSRSWIFNEVSTIANVLKYGTLKSSCRNYIESRLSHLFAGLIAYLDTNDNLDLLYVEAADAVDSSAAATTSTERPNAQQQAQKDMTRRLWLKMAQNEAFMNLEYKDHFVQKNGTTEKAEFACAKNSCVKRSSHQDSKLRLRLPFSWIVKDFLDELVHLNANATGDHAQVAMEPAFDGRRYAANTPQQQGDTAVYSLMLLSQKLENAFEKSNMFNLLANSIVEPERVYDFVRAYLNDFLLMASSDPFVSLAHLELVKTRILHVCEQNLRKSRRDLRILISIHVVYEQLRNEFKYLVKLIGVDDCVLKSLTSAPESQVKARSLALQAAKLVCTKYTRTTGTMDKAEWLGWFEQVKRFAGFIENFMQTALVQHSGGDDPSAAEDYYSDFKSTWERIVSTRYMIEHVSYLDDTLFIRSTQLWPLLGTHVNFRSYETFQKFEVFLRNLDERTQKSKVAEGADCKGCNNRLNRKLFVLNVCDTCLVCDNCRQTFVADRQCPGCHRKLADDPNVLPEATPIDTKDAFYLRFKISLNCLYMDIVSNLCLSNSDELPEKDVVDAIIKHLLPKSDCQDKRVLEFNLNPSIKSTLFQLLLSYDQQSIESYLEKIFSNSSNQIKNKYVSNDLAELNLMYISAFEDNLYAKSTSASSRDNSLLNLTNSYKYLHEISYDYLDDSRGDGVSYNHHQRRHSFSDEQNDSHIEKLRLIAKLRFVLTTYAHMASTYASTRSPDYFSREDSELNESMRQFIDDKRTSYLPRFFIIKLIFRMFGKQALINLSQLDNFSWIIPKDMQNSSKDVPDSYVVCGERYLKIRNCVRDSFLTGQVDKLAESLQGVTGAANSDLYTYLVVYKEIVLTKDQVDEKQDKRQTLLTEIDKVFPADRELFRSLLTGQMFPTHFAKDNQLSISLLVMHVYVALTKNPQVLAPFFAMLNAPGQFARAFLPTMPHDEDFEAFLAYKNTTQDAFKFYRCPNGHMYSIGNCTRPATTSTCPTCKAQIGGVDHKPSAGNALADDLVEKNQQGYCSISPEQRSDQAESIRNMGMLNTTLLRLLLDCVLYLGALKHRLSNTLISGSTDDAKCFFDHIVRDVHILSKFVQHSDDETLLFVHYLVNQLSSIQRPPQANFNPQLPTKEDRNRFEAQVCTDILDRLVNNKMDQIFNQVTDMMQTDAKKSDNDQLFRIAYDCIPDDFSASGLSVHKRLTTPTFDFQEKRYWAFRKNVTIEHMTSMLLSTTPKQVCEKKFFVLDRFVKQMPQLQMIKHLPSLCRMLKELHLLFDRQIERQYANSITLEQLCDHDDIVRNRSLRETIRQGATDFLKVWQACCQEMDPKCSLDSKSFIDSNNPDLQTNDFRQLKLSYLLSNQYNDGRYIYAVIFYLITLQNEFVYFYMRNRLRMERAEIEKLDKTNVENLTPSDCISFVAEKDILQIVFMHSNYSLENQKNLNLEYDFDKIQNSIERKIIHDKPLIDSSSIFLVKFSDDIKGKRSQFEALNLKVPQVEISNIIKDNLSSFYKQPNQLSGIIQMLRIVIDFVASSGCPRDMKIMDYAVNVLKMPPLQEETSASKLINDLEVVYLQSTWNLLSLKRVVLLTEHGQDPFDQLSSAFKAELNVREFIDKLTEEEIDLPILKDLKSSKSAGIKNSEAILLDFITQGRRHFNKIQLFNILALFYHYMTYQLINENQTEDSDEAQTGEHSLHDDLQQFNEELFENENEQKVDFDKYDFRFMQVKNVFDIWKVLVKAYSTEASKSF